MKKVFKAIMGFGFFVLLCGAGGMDSESVIVPLIMAFSGLAIFVTGAYMEDLYA